MIFGISCNALREILLYIKVKNFRGLSQLFRNFTLDFLCDIMYNDINNDIMLHRLRTGQHQKQKAAQGR